MMVIAILLHVFLSAQSPDLSAIEWLLGRWVASGANTDARSYEVWKKVSDKQFQGVGYTTAGSDTSFVETLQIKWHEGGFYYIADVPDNAVPVYFQISELSDTSLVCENPQHDYPTKIEYKKRGNSLFVEISSDKKSKRFHFSRDEE